MSYKNCRLALLAAASLGCVAGQQASAQEGGDIVVTARRIEERLQDVPISITVFSQEQLDDRNITAATDLATYTPALQTQNQFGANNAQFAIRGFVQDPFTAPSVGVYFADVIAPRGASSFQSGDGAGPGSFFDLQNVQVLKGPQGTLFGRNTTGGSILLVPQKPGYDFGGYIEQSAGNYDLNRTQAVLNVPLGEHARARFGVDRNEREGYIRNSIGDGDHFGDVNYWAGRASLVIDLAPNLENYTILTYAQSDTNGGLIIPMRCGVGGLAAMSCPQVNRLNAERQDNYFSGESLVNDPQNHLDQWQFINTTTWDVTDNLTVKNIFSYAELNNQVRSNVFGLVWDQHDINPALPHGFLMPNSAVTIPGGAINDDSTLTEEIQFQGRSLENRLKWQAGVYYEQVSQIPDRVGTLQGSLYNCQENGFYLVPNPVPGGPPIPNPAANCLLPSSAIGSSLNTEVRTSEYRDAAVYAQGTYDVTDRFNVEVGLRYTDDESTALNQGFTYRYSAHPVMGPIGNPLAIGGITCSDPAATLANNCTRTAQQHSNATTGEIVLGYALTDNWNSYLKYARGYRQGAVNPRGFGFLNSFGQEQIDTYELGFKGNWHGAMPGYLNIALFRNLLQHQQLNASYQCANPPNTCSPTAVASGVAAVGKTTVDGAELDGSISLFEGFRIAGGLAWLNSDLKSGGPVPYLPGWGPVNPGAIATANDLPFSPEWKYSITPSYRLPLPESVGDITLAATWTWTSDYVGGSGNGIVPSYGTLNLNAGWDHIFGSPVDLSLFGTNVLNEEYIVTTGDLRGTGLRVQYSVLGEPRMYGMRLRYSFGGEAH